MKVITYHDARKTRRTITLNNGRTVWIYREKQQGAYCYIPLYDYSSFRNTWEFRLRREAFTRLREEINAQG